MDQSSSYLCPFNIYNDFQIYTYLCEIPNFNAIKPVSLILIFSSYLFLMIFGFEKLIKKVKFKEANEILNNKEGKNPIIFTTVALCRLQSNIAFLYLDSRNTASLYLCPCLYDGLFLGLSPCFSPSSAL